MNYVDLIVLAAWPWREDRVPASNNSAQEKDVLCQIVWWIVCKVRQVTLIPLGRYAKVERSHKWSNREGTGTWQVAH